jgi:hypothetical protein
VRESIKSADLSNTPVLEHVERIQCSQQDVVSIDDSNIIIDQQEPAIAIIKEKSHLNCLQDDDSRTYIVDHPRNQSTNMFIDHVSQSTLPNVAAYDSMGHSDTKSGRIHLLIEYNDERSKLFVRILNVQDIIRPEQVYTPETSVSFTLIGPHVDSNQIEKHTRVIVESTTMDWKVPMSFCITRDYAMKQNLYVNVSNGSDPSCTNDREVSVTRQNEQYPVYVDLGIDSINSTD